jgi:hypothetical protein
MKYLLDKNLIWIRKPITDKPDIDNDRYTVYLDGTYECYELFRSKAKITTYKSLKWHLLVLWYLNPQLDQDEFMELATFIADKQNGFIAFAIHAELLRKIVYDVSIPGKPDLSKEDKLRIVGELIGRSKKVHADDIYECMLDLHDMGKKITIGRIAGLLDCSTRTIHRSMPEELKREKELLNQQL